MATLMDALDTLTEEGSLAKEWEKGKQCVACAHRCRILEGLRGICRVRFVKEGRLRVPFHYVAGLNPDPIEKKPFYHFLPGTLALTFGMLGCNFHCDYCQNWLTSQTLRDPRSGILPERVDGEALVQWAKRRGCRSLISSYNEPLITAEWAYHLFSMAKAQGLYTGFVSNGYGTVEVLRYMKPVMDGLKVDLKSFRDKHYRQLGGLLQPVLDTITLAKKMGYWVEVVTLLVPQFNDDEKELRDIARFIASVSPEIPWHITAFHPDYQRMGPHPTPPEAILRAAEIGKEEGLLFVYGGNIPGHLGNLENTRCPACGKTLIIRFGFSIRENLVKKGRCPSCHHPIPGIWDREPEAIHRSNTPTHVSIG